MMMIMMTPSSDVDNDDDDDDDDLPKLVQQLQDGLAFGATTQPTLELGLCACAFVCMRYVCANANENFVK